LGLINARAKLDMPTTHIIWSSKKVSSLEFAVNYKLSDDNSNVKSEGEAKAVLDEKYLTLMVAFGKPMLFSYADIVEISDYDYKVDLFFISKEKLNLWGLGYQYEDFLFQLFKFRNELLLKYLLMEESLLQAGFEAQFTRLDSNGQINQAGNCEIRLYDTALLVLPQRGEPIRLPYCYISQVSKSDYKIAVTSESGEKMEFSMLGEKFDPFGKALSDAFNKMVLRAQENIKELIPEADPSIVNNLAALMKDGRAAKRKDIELLSSDFWPRLTKRIEKAGISTEYEFLDSLAEKDQVCVGLKRGLMGDLTGSYTWMLFPLRNAVSGRLSNAIALEAFVTQNNSQGNEERLKETVYLKPEERSEQGPNEKQTSATAGATYFFKIIGRKEYPQTKDEDLTKKLENFNKNINRCMIDINFRREPIFLSEAQLESTKYVQYRFAIARMPSLRILRSLFIGRVIHSSPKQWKTDVTSLLAFNARSLDDTEKWKKGDR
jgi:hypothetical protein